MQIYLRNVPYASLSNHNNNISSQRTKNTEIIIVRIKPTRDSFNKLVAFIKAHILLTI